MSSEVINDGISTRLQSERKRLGLTQNEAADLCEVSSRTFLRWEKGTPIPSDKLLILHSKRFNIGYIVTGK
jgi:transcriptional regulator with XRE-family HTH domain